MRHDWEVSHEMKRFMIVLIFASTVSGLISYVLIQTKPCPTADVIVDNLGFMFAGHMECGNYDEMMDDIYDLVDDKHFCSDTFDPNDPDLLRVIPNGAWSTDSIACLSMKSDIEKLILDGEIIEDWNCQKTKLNMDVFTETCQRMTSSLKGD